MIKIKNKINSQINIDNSEEEIYNILNRSNIKIFTYEDYLNYQKLIKAKICDIVNIDGVQEESEPYLLKNNVSNNHKDNKIKNENDKICRKMLDIKIEAVQFINKIVHTNYKENEIEKYNRSFITINLENRESDIIYKIKNKNIFFLIEHQTKKDRSMAWRILEYSMEIIKSAIDYKKIGQKDYKLPLVVPIVIYTGKEKWDIKEEIGQMQEKLKGRKELKFGKYAIYDINNYTEEELLKEKTYLSKFMLIEKYKKGGDLSNCIDSIVKEINKNKEEYLGKGKDVLLIMIDKILKEKLGEEKAKEVIKKLKGESKEMLQILETIREENEEIRQEGIRYGKQMIIKEMLKRNMPIDLISEITNMTKKSIMKIAKNCNI